MTSIRLFIQNLVAWPTIPIGLDLVDYRRAVLLRQIMWILFAALILISGPWMLLLTTDAWFTFWALILAAIVIMAAALLLDSGQLNLAATSLVFGILLIAVPGNMVLDTTYGNDVPILLAILVFGSVLLTSPGIVVCSVLCVVCLWAIDYAHITGLGERISASVELGHALSGTIVLAMTSACSILVRHSWANAIRQIQSGATALAEKNTTLAVQNQTLETRTRQVGALLEVSNRIGNTLELRSLIPLMLESVKVALPYDDAFVIEREGNTLRAIGYSGPDDSAESEWEYSPEKDAHLRFLFESRVALIIPDVLADDALAKARRDRTIELKGYLPKFIRSCLYVPLLRRNEIVGYFILNSAKTNAYSAKDLPIANGLSHQFAMCIENARLYEGAMQIATMAERNRIARELHDSVSQALFGIVLGMRTLAEVSRISPSKMEEAMNYVIRLADVALVEIRALIFELRPEYLEKEGLISALKKQVEGLCMRYQIELKMQVDAEEAHLSGRAKEALYRIGLEATRNTIKHANARTIHINLNEVGQQTVTLEINDDGNGFDPNASFDGHLGIISMRERAQQFGGDFEVVSQYGQGTTVRVSIPIPA